MAARALVRHDFADSEICSQVCVEAIASHGNLKATTHAIPNLAAPVLPARRLGGFGLSAAAAFAWVLLQGSLKMGDDWEDLLTFEGKKVTPTFRYP